MAAYAQTVDEEPEIGPISEESDEVLAFRAASDPDAMTELYRRYRPRIDRYCRQKVSDPDHVQDIASQVFVKVLEGVAVARITRFRPWIFAIAHNVIVNDYRSRRPAERLDMVESMPDFGPTPEQHAFEQNDRQTLSALLTRLTEAERQVMELRLSGLTNPEISAQLDRSYSWVGSTQHRAYRHLKALVDHADRKDDLT